MNSLEQSQSANRRSPASGCCATAKRFVSDYADSNLCVVGSPTGCCDGCEHYRPGDNYSAEDVEDWCWLKEGKYADGREAECPAWKSHNTELCHADKPKTI